MLRVSRSRRKEYALSYSSDDDPSSLAVDAEGQTARFVTKTLRVCCRLLVLYLGTDTVVAVIGEVSFYSQNKR